jgi:hypothetical protein
VVYELYGSQGILQGTLGELPSDTWLDMSHWLSWTGRLGVGEDLAIALLCGLYLLGLTAFTIGWHTRAATVVTWFTHLVLNNTQATAYGLDQFAHMALFLLIWAPAGDALSFDCRRTRVCRPGASWQARLSLRAVQLWLCIAYLGAGIMKAIGPQWWTGEAIWRSLMLPSYIQFDMAWLSGYPSLARCLTLGTLLTEVGYAFFIWPRRTRGLWIAMTLMMHAGIGIFLGLHLFAIIMCVLTVSAFAVSPAVRSPVLVQDRVEGDEKGRKAQEENLRNRLVRPRHEREKATFHGQQSEGDREEEKKTIVAIPPEAKESQCGERT